MEFGVLGLLLASRSLGFRVRRIWGIGYGVWSFGASSHVSELPLQHLSLGDEAFYLFGLRRAEPPQDVHVTRLRCENTVTWWKFVLHASVARDPLNAVVHFAPRSGFRD
jgi:hypothetical protein